MLSDGVEMDPGSGFDLWVYRTYAESLLGGTLMDLRRLVSGWSGFVGVINVLYCIAVVSYQDYRTVTSIRPRSRSGTVPCVSSAEREVVVAY